MKKKKGSSTFEGKGGNGEFARQNKESGEEIEKGGSDGLIVDLSISRQEIDAQIDRLDDEFQKKESSGGVHELERDGCQNSAGLREIWPGGEYMDRHPIQKVAGGDEKAKEGRPNRKRREKKKPWKLN